MYEDYGEGFVVTFERLTARRDPIYQAIEPGRYREHLLLGGTAIAAGLAAELKRVVPAVREVAVPEGGAGSPGSGGLAPGRARGRAPHSARCSPSGQASV